MGVNGDAVHVTSTEPPPGDYITPVKNRGMIPVQLLQPGCSCEEIVLKGGKCRR
jgi:hypothetical protein